MNKPGLLTIAIILAVSTSLGVFYFYNSQLRKDEANITVAPPLPVKTEEKTPARKSFDVIGHVRPEFSLPDVHGTLHHINEWDGKVVVLNFWATWCPPCRKEIPEFIHLQEKYAEQGVQFIGLALEDAEPVIKFMQDKGMNYPVLNGELEVLELGESYGNNVSALPYTVIINHTGHISFVKAGPLAGVVAEEVIIELLNEKNLLPSTGI